MSRRKAKNESRPLVLDCDPGDAGDLARDNRARRARPRKQKADKKVPPFVPCSCGSGTRISEPKRPPKSPAIDEAGAVDARPVKANAASAPNLITMDANIRKAAPELPQKALPQCVGASAVAEPSAGMAKHVELVATQRPRILFADNPAESGTEKADNGMPAGAEGVTPERTDLGLQRRADQVSQPHEMGVEAPGNAVEVTVDLDVCPTTELRPRNNQHWLARAWEWARKHLGSRQARKRLRVCETVSLGEKRFLAVIEIDGTQFLLGGASSSVVTLARLEPSHEFSEVLQQRWAQDPVQA